MTDAARRAEAIALLRQAAAYRRYAAEHRQCRPAMAAHYDVLADETETLAVMLSTIIDPPGPTDDVD